MHCQIVCGYEPVDEPDIYMNQLYFYGTATAVWLGETALICDRSASQQAIIGHYKVAVRSCPLATRSVVQAGSWSWSWICGRVDLLVD